MIVVISDACRHVVFISWCFHWLDFNRNSNNENVINH